MFTRRDLMMFRAFCYAGIMAFLATAFWLTSTASVWNSREIEEFGYLEAAGLSTPTWSRPWKSVNGKKVQFFNHATFATDASWVTVRIHQEHGTSKARWDTLKFYAGQAFTLPVKADTVDVLAKGGSTNLLLIWTKDR